MTDPLAQDEWATLEADILEATQRLRAMRYIGPITDATFDPLHAYAPCVRCGFTLCRCPTAAGEP